VTVNEKELAECLRLIFSILNKYLCWIDLPEDLLLVGDDLLQTFAMLLVFLMDESTILEITGNHRHSHLPGLVCANLAKCGRGFQVPAEVLLSF